MHFCPPTGRNELDIKECVRLKKGAESVFLRLSKVLFEYFGTITAERQLLRTH